MSTSADTCQKALTHDTCQKAKHTHNLKVMKIAVEGCAHGELDNIYAAIKQAEDKEKTKIDLLICCGDFQSSRNADDLACMAVPPKYRDICSFYKYFSGEKKAPILTIFIGGNHEASNYLQELPYGGWVAPNIYYLGYAGIINVAGVRIGGLSGIYKGRDYLKGRYEKPPYDENAKRSVYHIRNLEVFRLKQLSQPMDIFISHDWPTGVYHHGNVRQLLKIKPFFKDEIETNQLGSKPCEDLLKHIQPRHWFSAHLHCKFTALVPHEENPPTNFLALDKCLPKRQFLQIVDVPHDDEKKIQIEYDLEWLTILHLTNHLLHVKNTTNYMPGPGGNERYNFTPSDKEKDLVLAKMQNTLKVPKNFRPTAAAYQAGTSTRKSKQPEPKLNPQTVEFCEILGIDDPISLISEKSGLNLSLDSSFLENTTFIIDSDESADESMSALDTEPESEIKDMEQSKEKKLTPMKLPQPKIVPEADDSCSAVGNETESNVELTNCVSNEVDQNNTEAESVVEISKTSQDSSSCDDASITDATACTPTEGSLLVLSQESRKASPKRELNDDDAISVNSEKCISSPNDPDNTAIEAKCETPTPKKFKRRNASIYGVESCDS